jgi:hypothetical protein
MEGKGFTDRGGRIRQSCAAESMATADQGSRVETRMMPSVIEGATYGCSALSPCSDLCKWSVSILVSQVACAEGKRGASQYYIDLLSARNVRLGWVFIIRLQSGKEDGILTIVMASPHCVA